MTTTSSHPSRRLLILVCILSVYVFNVERSHPAVFFGQFHDDSIYLSTAKALADGQGYSLISFPESPPQTKVPIIYPWLLSFVWKLNPNFPANLPLAIHLTEFFGCWSLIASFFLFRKLSGIGEPTALMLTAACAFEPLFVRMSGLVMTDMPFMACLLTVLAIGVFTSGTRRSVWIYLLLGVLAGLSVGVRTVGVALVAGVCCALIANHKKSLAPAIVFAVTASVVVLLVMSPTSFHRAFPAGLTGPGGPGWDQIAASYYKSYAQYELAMGIPSFGAFLQLLKLNLFLLLISPGPIVVGTFGKLGTSIAMIFSIPIWIGLVRHRRYFEWRPVTLTFFFYSCIMLIWPFPQHERFLLPFIPVLMAALYCETSRLGALLRTKLRSGATEERILAGLACLLAGLFGGMVLWNFLVHDPRQRQIAAIAQAQAQEQREQAYRWIRENTRPDDRLASWKDIVLYLYTGRQGLRPIAILPQAYYAAEEKSEQRDLAHMCDASRRVGVRYWMTTADDFNLEIHPKRLMARMAEIGAVLPIVFVSSSGYAQIHDASCLMEEDKAECKAIATVLFPQ